MNCYSKNIVIRSYSRFIPRYVFPQYNMLKSDFKGHQMKALRKIESLAPQLNMILELRDVRAPLSTKNILFDKMLKEWKYNDIERLIIYTKKDLMQNQNSIINRLNDWHNEMNEQFMLVDARNKKDAQNLYKIIQFKSTQLMNKMGMPLPLGFKILITGIPNLGKSTLINSLRFIGKNGEDLVGRRKKVAKTGNEAGITRSTSECIKITPNNNKTKQSVYIIDTPGIGLPGKASNEIRMLSQSLCGSLKTNLIDPIIVADYLLYIMNLQKCYGKQEFYPNYLNNPTNDIYEVLQRLRTNKSQDDRSLAIKWTTHWSHHGKNITFDIETLLSSDEFSYKNYIQQELEKLENLSINPKENDKTKSINKLFY